METSRKKGGEREYWKDEEKNSRPSRFHISPICHVHLIHRREIIHIGQKDIDFDDVIDIRPRGGEDGCEIGYTLVLFPPLLVSFFFTASFFLSLFCSFLFWVLEG